MAFPWEEVVIDLIGNWTVKVTNRNFKLNSLTCIYTASNLVELIWIDNKTLHHTKEKNVQCWLVCYTCPVNCVCEKGGEFIGETVKWLLYSFSITHVQFARKISNQT
jgi:hypothetical protein